MFSKKNFRVAVAHAKIHESYEPHPYFLNDIAIIELEIEVNKTGITYNSSFIIIHVII